MSFTELAAYIADLRQSGFDTEKLSVQLNASSPTPPSPSSWPSSPSPSPSPPANAAVSPASPSPSCWPSSISASPASLKPWATSTPSPPPRRLVRRPPLLPGRRLGPPPHPHLAPREAGRRVMQVHRGFSQATWNCLRCTTPSHFPPPRAELRDPMSTSRQPIFSPNPLPLSYFPFQKTWHTYPRHSHILVLAIKKQNTPCLNP